MKIGRVNGYDIGMFRMMERRILAWAIFFADTITFWTKVFESIYNITFP